MAKPPPTDPLSGGLSPDSPTAFPDPNAPGDLATPAEQLTAPDSREGQHRRNGRPGARAIDILYRYSVLWALVLESVVFSILRPQSFFTAANGQSILGSQAILLIVALGLTIPLAVNEFD